MSEVQPNLYLVGFMGSGKTTVGRAVAQRLGFQFLDSDHEIERLVKKSIPDIFAQEGEAAFRALERSFVEAGHPAGGCVVACGGGIIVPPGMLELLLSRGVVICLHATIETVLKRISGFKHRPLVNVDGQELRIRTLFAQREPIYRRAGTMVLTDQRPLSEIAGHVARSYRRDSLEFLRKKQ